MKLPRFEYAAAQSIDEACRLLETEGDDARAIAGGTDLIMALKNRQQAPRLLVDISALRHLDRIRYTDEEGLKLGAMVSLSHLAADPVVRERYPLLQQAALSVGSPQLQAMGTVGGNLCQDTCCMFFNRSPIERQSLDPCHKLEGDICHVVNYSEECWATYAGDLAPALLALRARVKIENTEGERIVPLQGLYSRDGKRPLTLQPGELVTAVLVPVPPTRSGGAYLKLRQRETLDYPLLGVAVHLEMKAEGGICQDASLALTAVDRAPVVVPEAEWLKDKRLTDDFIRELGRAARTQAQPIKNLCGLTRSYRVDMVNVFVESAVKQALENATDC